MTRLIIGALAVGLALAVGAVALSQSQRTANIEVRVWEDVNDPERNFISARPEGGSWRTLGTIPLPLTDGVSSSGRFRYGDITLAVPLGEPAGASASGEGKTTARLSLPKGVYVCRSEWARNSRGNVDWNFIAYLHGADDRTLLANSNGGEGVTERVFRSAGGEFIYEVTSAADTAGWTITCERQ